MLTGPATRFPRRVGLSIIARCLVALLMLYVALDFSTPLLPGAFDFDPDRSVEGFYSGQNRLDAADPVFLHPSFAVEPLALRPRAPLVIRAPRAARTGTWQARVTRSSLASHRTSPAPGEDH